MLRILMSGCVALMTLMCGFSAIGAVMNKKKIAEEAIASLDFEMGHFRIEKDLVRSFEIKVKHFMWKRLVECKSRGDTLGFLNAADDIVNGRSDPTTTYKSLPDGNTIQALCSGLRKAQFRCEFCSNGRKLVALKEDEKWRRFIARCKSSEIRLDKATGKILYKPDRDYVPFVPVGFLTEVKAGEKFAVFGNELVYIGEKGSIDKYAQNDFRKNVEDLCKQLADQEISLSEFKAKLMKMDSDIREKIKTQLSSMTQKEAPTPDVRTKSDFGAKVMEVSFCVGDHVDVQECLVPYIHTAIVDESLLKLRRYQLAREWDKMIELILPGADLENPKVYAEAWKTLQERRFSVNILFTIDIPCYGREIAKAVPLKTKTGVGEMEIGISVTGNDMVYVYAAENGLDPLQKNVGRPGFDINKWMRTHVGTNKDSEIPSSITRTGYQDRSLLLERRLSDEHNYSIPLPSDYQFSLDKVLYSNADVCYCKLMRVYDEIKSPSVTVITNVVEEKDSRGKPVKTTYRRVKKNIPREVERYEKIFAHPDFIDAYRKYGGLESPKILASEWKQACGTVGDPKPLSEDIKRRFNQAYRDHLTKQELRERYEVYDRRAKGQDFRPEDFRRWALEDQQIIVYERFVEFSRTLGQNMRGIMSSHKKSGTKKR